MPFSGEEVTIAIVKLKGRKAAGPDGPDGLTGEYLKEGRTIVVWLKNILNSVVELEVIPDALKSVVMVPVYKGGGKDPLKVDSYRGVTLMSVIAKVLEFLVLGRLQMLLAVAEIPHVN